MARRRGPMGSPVSLFAFQDVMTAVIGILLLVLLLMALEMTLVAAGAGGVASAADDRASGAAEVERLEARVAEARARLERVRAQLSDRPPVTRTPLIERLSERLAELTRLYEEVRAADAETAEVWERLRAEADPDDATAAVLGRRIELARERDALQAELDELRLNTRLTYIAQKGFAKQPVIVEIAGDAFRAGAAEEGAAALTFAHPSPKRRLDALAAFLEANFPPASHYPLIVLKPSGAEHEKAVRERLLDIGFRHSGVDLIPEGWTTLQRALPDEPARGEVE